MKPELRQVNIYTCVINLKGIMIKNGSRAQYPFVLVTTTKLIKLEYIRNRNQKYNVT